MAGSTLDPDNIPARRGRKTVKGTDVKSLGPSDTSDSGSDMAGPGEHLSAGVEPRIRPNQDRDVDRVVSESEAGLGRGLDEAEEARRKKDND